MTQRSMSAGLLLFIISLIALTARADRAQSGNDSRHGGSTAIERANNSTLSIHGRVVDQKDRPITGARVAAIARRKTTRRGGDFDDLSDVLGEATTGRDGQFEMRVPSLKPEDIWGATLIVRAEGHGLAWQSLDTGAARLDLSFMLADEHLIRGRFVDLQGQPTAGVRARFASIVNPQTGFADGAGFDSARGIPAAWPAPVVSDSDGRVTIRGVAAGLGVMLEVEGNDRFAQQSLALNTGLSEQRGQRDGTYRPQGVRNLKPGEEAVFALAPAQIVEGLVRFADTKRPVPGARITVFASQQKFRSSIGVMGRADGQGRFHISPYPGIEFRVTAYPPHDEPYLIRQTVFDWKPAMTKGQADLDLPRGVLVRGVIVEAGSNRPVVGASVQYHPQAKTSQRAPDGVLTGWDGIELSDSTGRFAIPVLPGQGTLLVHGPMGRYVLSAIGSRELDGQGVGGVRYYAHAIRGIDPPIGSAPVEMTIPLAPGETVTGRLLMPNGRPAEEAVMTSRLFIFPSSPTWRAHAEVIRGRRFSVGGCDPSVAYPVYFLAVRSHLGATALIKASDAGKTPLNVRLSPCGSVRMRFVDSKGHPVRGIQAVVEIVVTPGSDRFDLRAFRMGRLAEDADLYVNVVSGAPGGRSSFPESGEDGRATVDDLIPGASYRLTEGLATSRRQFDFSIQPGQTRDLGDIVVDEPPRT